MNQVSSVTRHSHEDSVKSVNVDIVSVSSQGDGRKATKAWKPPALRSPILIATILLCWALIAVLQVFLSRSQRDGGVIFAARLSALPLHQQFLYLYLPTILAVLFSIYWAWIDLETKRMEPYYQLSKEKGALGKDSLLLAYPFDFIPLVPIKAAKERHWPVFWGSLAVLLVTWGLVPTQAGIFAVETITRTSSTPFNRSTSFMPAEDQLTKLTIRYAQSTYGIATLNETLPPYMARNFTLAPFKPSVHDVDLAGSQGTWTGETTMYSLDMYCAPSFAIRDTNGKSKSVTYKSSGGCNVTMGLTGNITQGSNPNTIYSPLLTAKQYTGMHIGYWGYTGFADFYLEGDCPTERNGTFYAAFTKNKARDQDPPENVTAIFCEPFYYQQKVNATIDHVSKEPLHIAALGDKKPLSKDLFNATNWEAQMTTGSSGFNVRGDNMPTASVPDYLEYVTGTNVSIGSGPTGVGLVQPMVGLSLALNQLSLEDFLDWKILSKSYADAYRLMFSRTMVDILGDDFQSSEDMVGIQRYTTEAVVLEPVFTYVSEGLLGVISLATIMLLYLSVTRTRNLRTDPSTIASIMSLVADNEPLLVDFENLDCCTAPEVQKALGARRYRLVHDGQRAGIETVDSAADAIFAAQRSATELQRQGTSRDIAKPVRPKEFRMWTAVPFVSLFIALSIALAVIFVRARANGLPLPSTIKLVQNILENYIPTALATLIEPMWIMINRLLCMLQPIEELRSCKAEAKDSIDLNYSSLPPQLTIFKALSSKHFVLATVCAMALLSNLLAVAFAGIFNQDFIEMQRDATFTPPFDMKFVSINGSIGPKSGQEFGSREPSGAYRGGNSQDQFLIAESNWTRGTPLPAWTDTKMFYLPYKAADPVNSTVDNQYEAATTAFGAELDCETLQYGIDYSARIRKNGWSDMRVDFNVTARANSNTTVCPANGSASILYGPAMPAPISIEKQCQRGPSAAEIMFVLDAPANATRGEEDACMTTVVMGWLRTANGSCGDFQDTDLNAQNSLFVRCRPRFVTGQATVRTDLSGRLQREISDVELSKEEDISEMFSNDVANLIGQSNRYIFKSSGGNWHNDSYANDPLNYFASREANNSRLLDPNTGAPTLEDVEKSLGKAYSRLFAIWLGANKEKLLVTRSDQPRRSIQGWTITTERRLFLSTPMFAISEGILFTYVFVAIMVYLRRPGRYLARMPTSIASIISLFAATAAVQDMKGTSHLNRQGRAKYLRDLDARYGYGSYIGGGDGRVHIGVEKTPFVRARAKSTWLDQKLKSFRKGSAV
ncbi:uncharacterized protein M421DRAFT_5341 [Didymella exigua CBS 183.55]|uniref:Uncharacterized protein n=1 Tax=Didymella exigua CBS 183.55 TaxID=1150837 RepID=A0A6A5RKF6_9PLEO|nr:uncharacterized protein M421DRAFT_5341 [Didymella exigua CBS 183.55]KAF1928282.1 hypothetical protein M421DRAFT_5341 [Didymella exigua CBS 183.55]